ncbi:MAG: diguanylate cyclase [Planctomycetota bacterium]
MLDRLDHAILVARRNLTRIAVIFLDIDQFKEINDKFGHATGDLAIQMVARRLKSTVRSSDTVSRYGGDEFVVLLAEVAHASDVELIARSILAALAEPGQVGEHELSLSASLGIAIFPEDSEDAVTLIGLADAAMYRAKRSAAGSFAFHSRDQAYERSIRHIPARSAATPGRQSQGAAEGLELEPRLQVLLEANEQLVVAAVMAQQLEAESKDLHRRQVRFMAVAAHELRNPLNPIKVAASLLTHAFADQPLLTRAQEMIQSQLVQMTRLVDDLIDESRSSVGKLRIEFGNVELSAVLALSVETCRPRIEFRKHHLTLEIPSGPLLVNGDAVRLAQVFINLLENASKYTRPGGEIAIRVVADEVELSVSVSDNGIGITPIELPAIFDLFVQDPRALTLNKGGLGIGLAVVRDLVQAHGGSVIAKSAGRDLGSEFIVTLPIQPSAVATVLA